MLERDFVFCNVLYLQLAWNIEGLASVDMTITQ